jgi:hypothetical protein
MAVTSLRTEPPAATPDEFERLYRAWRYAKAAWDLADNDPARPEGLSEEEREAHCDAEHAALIAFIMCPVTAAEQLAQKARIILDEGAWQFGEAREVFEQIARDARTLAYPSAGHRS